MANLSEQQVLGMLFDPDFDSGGESDIDEGDAVKAGLWTVDWTMD